MLTRQMMFPVSAERLWEALVAPSEWMGTEVEWELVEGGQASFRQGEDGDRRGQVREVAPGRRLRFRWWPERDRQDESEVTYDLEPEPGGTRLTVTERRVAAPLDAPPAPNPGPAQASAAWTSWDSRAAGLWALAGVGPGSARVGGRQMVGAGAGPLPPRA